MQQRVHRGRTMFATSASIQASWQVSLAYVRAVALSSEAWKTPVLTLLRSLTPGLANGGTGGVFWTFIFTAIFALSNVFSIAEYTSMSVAHPRKRSLHWEMR